MYEGINQYHVVMEIDPKFQQNPDGAQEYLRPFHHRPAGSPERLHPLRSRPPPRSPVTHQGQFPGRDHLLQPGPQCPARRRGGRRFRTWNAPSVCPPRIHPGFQGTAQAFQASLSTEPYLILAALATVYIVLGMLYENYVHPITILSTLPSAGVGALLAILVTQ